MQNLIKRIKQIDYNVFHYINFNILNNIQAFWDCTIRAGKIKNQFYAKRMQIKEIQNKKLQEIITYAYSKVNYYKDLFDKNGINPDEIKGAEDLRKIPITKRSKFQQLNYKNIVSKDINIKQCQKFVTSGSTGIPLSFYLYRKTMGLRGLHDYVIQRINGRKLRDSILHIIGRNYYYTKKFIFMYFGIGKAEYMSVYHTTDKILERFLLVKPKVIYGYVSKLIDLALKIKEEKISVHVKQIYTTAEVLRDKQRKLLMEIFNAEVFDIYSSNETGVIAWECKEHKGLHVDDMNVVVELIDDKGNPVKDGIGRVVVTSLSSYATPFIRYEIGDYASFKKGNCKCPVRSVLLERIYGREVDLIQLKDRKINPYYELTDIIDDFGGIYKYRVVQNSLSSIKICIVKNDKFKKEMLNSLLAKCSKILGEEIGLEYEFVNELPKESTHKFKTVVSNIR